MSRGKHSKRRLPGGRITAGLLIALGVLLVLAGGSAYAAYRYDRSHLDRILPGISVAGVDVSGMTRDQAVAAVVARTDLSLGSDLTVKAGSKTWHVTPADLGMSVDVPAAVDRAFAVADGMSFFSRVYHRVADKPVDRSFSVHYKYDKAKVASFVGRAEKAVNAPAVNASVDLVGEQVVFTRSETGLSLESGIALSHIRSALIKHRPTAKLPVKVVRPSVTQGNIGATIVVNRSVNTLSLYEGFKLDRSYPVATAKPGFVTPSGEWTVVNKVENPEWINPDPTGWGAGEPAVIPPGPGNPLGTRALYLSAPGIRIHGTYDTASVGTYASHGCIRMTITDSEALYPLVPVGTKVIIL